MDSRIDKESQWQQEFRLLRSLMPVDVLQEDLKWGQPCYTLDGANVVLMHGFKDYCALLFLKGALIEDSAGLLVQQTENVQSARQMRFAGTADIRARENVIKDYLQQAIAIERKGLKVEGRKVTADDYPAELTDRFDAMPELRTAFEGLTPGRRRAYVLHFTGAKQSATRASRVEKFIPAILAGKGMDD